MKLLFITLIATVSFAGSSFAQESTSQNPDKATKAVEAVTGKDKKARKKKVEMCAECGKPESECECHGHGKAGESKKDHSGH